MAHQTVESLLAQAARIIGRTKSHDHTARMLRDFSKSAGTLRDALSQDIPLEKAELLFMDNHMRVLEMAYLRWKRKHVWQEDTPRERQG